MHSGKRGLCRPGEHFGNGLNGFEPGSQPFADELWYSILLIRNEHLYVFLTRAGDAPERIYLATVELAGDWQQWQASAPVEVLRPESLWEGADLPIEPSRRGCIDVRVNQLRDPGIFEENGAIYLLYSVAGESGDRHRPHRIFLIPAASFTTFRLVYKLQVDLYNPLFAESGDLCYALPRKP